MSKTFKGDVTGNVVELNLLDANEGTLPNLGTPTVVTKNTGPNVVEQIVGDIPASQYVFSGIAKGLVIGTSCTSIGSNAFGYCSTLTGDLVIPNSVTSIGSYAFASTSVTSLTIGNSVTSIGDYSFYFCFDLTGSLVIPDSVASIGSFAFDGCYGLTSLTIGNSVTTIGNYAFGGCNGLSGSLIIPNNVTSIGSYAFLNCIGLYTAYLAPPLANVASNAFLSSGLSTIYAKDAVANGWTLGAGQTVGGKSNVTVIDWTNYPNIP